MEKSKKKDDEHHVATRTRSNRGDEVPDTTSSVPHRTTQSSLDAYLARGDFQNAFDMVLDSGMMFSVCLFSRVCSFYIKYRAW